MPPTRPAALHTHQHLAKSILKQFEVLKAKPGAILDQATQALANLAKGLDSEECTSQEAWEPDNEEDD